MLTRNQFILKIKNVDWGFFDKDYPGIAFLLRCSEDYGYVEQIADGKITAANDARMKVAGELIKKGIEFIPVVGDLLTMIADFAGVDLGALGSISDSGTARQRLMEWISWINQKYTKNQFGAPDILEMNQRFVNATQLLVNARPKCGSPTANCSKEHQKYIARTSLLKESQQAIYDIYYNYCVDDNTFKQWLLGLGGNQGGGNVTTTQSSKAGLLALVGLGLLFAKRGGV